jgi:hypothetical protein
MVRKLHFATEVSTLQNSQLVFIEETSFFLSARHERPLGRPRRRWEENVKLDLTVIKTEIIGRIPFI